MLLLMNKKSEVAGVSEFGIAMQPAGRSGGAVDPLVCIVAGESGVYNCENCQQSSAANALPSECFKRRSLVSLDEVLQEGCTHSIAACTV